MLRISINIIHTYFAVCVQFCIKTLNSYEARQIIILHFKLKLFIFVLATEYLNQRSGIWATREVLNVCKGVVDVLYIVWNENTLFYFSDMEKMYFSLDL